MVADMDRIDLQNVASVLESRQSRPEHRADFAGPGLAIEVDRVAAHCRRRFHDVLSPAISQTNGRRTDSAFTSKTAKAETREVSRVRRALERPRPPQRVWRIEQSPRHAVAGRRRPARC